MMAVGTECLRVDRRLTVHEPGVLCCVNYINCPVTMIFLWPVVLSIPQCQYCSQASFFFGFSKMFQQVFEYIYTTATDIYFNLVASSAKMCSLIG